MSIIPQRRISDEGPALSELSLGCAQLGNLYREVGDAEAQATVDAAWELGVRYFDTAPHYGLGLSERRLGAALASRRRDSYVLSSKVGRLLEPVSVVAGLDDDGFVVPATHRRVWDFSRDGIRRSIEESLERLGLDRVDIAYLHDPDNHIDDVLATRLSRRSQSSGTRAQSRDRRRHERRALLARLVRATDMDVVMLAGRYTLLEQDSLDDLLPSAWSAASGWSRPASSTAASLPARSLRARPSTTTRRPRASSSTSPGDRRRLRPPWDEPARSRDRFPARAPGGRQRLPGRPIGEAGAAERRPLREADRRRPLVRAEGVGAPSS